MSDYYEHKLGDAEDTIKDLLERIEKLNDRYNTATQLNHAMKDVITKRYGAKTYWELYNETIKTTYTKEQANDI